MYRIAYLKNDIVKAVTSVNDDADLIELAKISGCDILELQKNSKCAVFMKHVDGEFTETPEYLAAKAIQEERLKKKQPSIEGQ
jgi:hypothetical protein